MVEEAHREDVIESGGLEGEAAAEVGHGAAEMTDAVAFFQGPLDHGEREVGGDEAGALPQDETCEAAVAAGRVQDKRTVRAGPGFGGPGTEAGERAAQKTPLTAVDESLVETSVPASLVIRDPRAIKGFGGRRLILQRRHISGSRR